MEFDLNEDGLLKHVIRIGYIVGIYFQSDIVVGIEWCLGELKRAAGPIRRSTGDFIIIVMPAYTIPVPMEWRFGEMKRAAGPIWRSTDNFIIVVMSDAGCRPSTVFQSTLYD
eukprot:CAMPEP_0172489784 /NCGR_PEP_ID=MMETSP1066-20121228/20001_1 /TAXON_ID=671091 /ORGANISM="Coscinodiscus wailesii, Strain CCMP2513" /LENGTH=111 /DNA_ID=CAMNT_0013257889 /DNA_START=61 /DNA_END=393 /DNA_ORIENTATION=+